MLRCITTLYAAAKKKKRTFEKKVLNMNLAVNMFRVKKELHVYVCISLSVITSHSRHSLSFPFIFIRFWKWSYILKSEMCQKIKTLSSTFSAPTSAELSWKSLMPLHVTVLGKMSFCLHWWETNILASYDYFRCMCIFRNKAIVS